MSFQPVSKRFGINVDRFPTPLKLYFANLQKKSQIPATRRDLPEVSEERQFQSFKDWKYLPGDRVMIVKGKYKGTVTKIAAHQESTNGFFLEDGPTKEIVVPKVYWRQSQDSHVVDYPVAVTRDYFKLVGAIVNETTGKSKTFAANDVVFRGKYWDESHKKMLPYRCVKNKEHIVIPWPAPELKIDDLMCTPELKLLERTYFPTSIVHSGLPADLRQSLKSPLMKRKIPRHEKHIITKSDLKRLTYPKMPEPAFKAEVRKEKEMLAKNKLEFTSEMAEFIGQKVAKHLNNIKNPYMKLYIDSVAGDKEKKK